MENNEKRIEITKQIKEKLVELKKTYSVIKDNFSSIEEQSKNALINPMLVALGYTFSLTIFPCACAEFTVKHSTGSKQGDQRADYAIFMNESALRNSTPAILIEAKSLDTFNRTNKNSQIEGLEQLKDYCNYQERNMIGVLTDGYHYKIIISNDTTTMMNPEPILDTDLDELSTSEEKLNLFIDYLYADEVIKYTEDFNLLFQKVEKYVENSKITDYLHKILTSTELTDSILNDQTIKYIMRQSGVVPKNKTLTGPIVSSFREKLPTIIKKYIDNIKKETSNKIKAEIRDSLNNDDWRSTAEDSQRSASSIENSEEECDVPEPEKSNIITTQLELDIIAKIQTMLDDSDLPKRLWSKNLNDWFPVEIKYKDTSCYICLFISDLSNDTFKDPSKQAPGSWAIRYSGENDINKGYIAFNANVDDMQWSVPEPYELRTGKGPGSQVGGMCRTSIHSMEDIEALKPAIIQCFRDNIKKWQLNNPEPKE